MVCAVTTRITPGSVLRREEDYPDDLAGAAAMRGVRLVTRRRRGRSPVEAGTLRAVNVALLGAASTVLPFNEEQWRRGLEAAVPAKILDVNLRAFELGRAAVASQEVES